MFRYFDPISTVQDYYENIFSITSNKQSSLSIKLSSKIEELRNLSKIFFNLNSSSISFQPNLWTVETIIFNNFDISQYVVYTDEIENIWFKNSKEINEIFDFFDEKLSKIKKDEKIIIWLTKLETAYSFENIKKIREQNQNLIIYVCFDFLIYEEIQEFTQLIDFFTFNPYFSFDVSGLVLFSFFDKLDIKPVYLGSNSVSSFDTTQITLNDLPHSLEIGTQNFPNLLVLERYFYFLNYKYDEIKKNIKKNKNLFEFIDGQKYLANFNKI